jgi:hypothetical protein
MDAFQLAQIVHNPGNAQRPDEASKSRRRRDLAISLTQQGAAPGRLVADDPMKFESTFVYPTLRGLLHQVLKQYTTQSVLDVAIEELERVHGERARREREVVFRQRFPVTSIDAVAESASISEETSWLTRTCELVLEETLVLAPNGSQYPDRVQWREILALAHLMLQSAFRSEDAHLGLRPVSTEVTESFEIHQLDDGPEPDLDISAINDAVKKEKQIGAFAPFVFGDDSHSDEPPSESLPDEEPSIQASSSADSVSDVASSERQSILVRMPELAEISSAMVNELGFSLDTLIQVPADLRRWPVLSGEVFEWANSDQIASSALTKAQALEKR